MCSRKIVMNTGFVLSALANCCFGQLLLEDSNIYSLGLFCSLAQGVGYACVSCSNYSLLLLLFGDSMITKICWVEGMTGFGIVFCQLTGSVMYSIGGYGLVFYFYGALCMLPVPIVSSILPGMEKRPKPPLLK